MIILYSNLNCIQINLYSIKKNMFLCIQNFLWFFWLWSLQEQYFPGTLACEPKRQQYEYSSYFIYARVSSTNDRQNTQRQIEDLTRFANSNNYSIVGTYEEHISGATKNENRTILMECLDFCVSQNANFLLLSELSRLVRYPASMTNIKQ